MLCVAVKAEGVEEVSAEGEDPDRRGAGEDGTAMVHKSSYVEFREVTDRGMRQCSMAALAEHGRMKEPSRGHDRTCKEQRGV